MQTTLPIYEDIQERVLPVWFDNVVARARVNMRGAAKLVMALFPLIILLVGSCKTADMPSAYGGAANPDQFRIALFPDRVNFTGVSYYPAEGYIARAQKFVSSAPETLDMLTEDEVGYLFGKPAFARKDAAAEVWQYKAGACVVDFFFYSDNTPNARRVAYVDVRPIADGGADVLSTHCLKDVISKGDYSSQRI